MASQQLQLAAQAPNASFRNLGANPTQVSSCGSVPSPTIRTRWFRTGRRARRLSRASRPRPSRPLLVDRHGFLVSFFRFFQLCAVQFSLSSGPPSSAFQSRIAVSTDWYRYQSVLTARTGPGCKHGVVPVPLCAYSNCVFWEQGGNHQSRRDLKSTQFQ